MKVKAALAGFAAVMWVLSTLARRYPHVAWLRRFADVFPRPTAAERERQRRRGDYDAGIQLILIGVSLPLVALALTLMTWSDITTTGVALVLAASVACIALGAMAIRHSRRRAKAHEDRRPLA